MNPFSNLFKKTVILFISLSVLLLSGCWNKRELNEIAIVTGAGVDVGEKPGEITFIYQIIIPSAFGSQSSSSVTPFITLKTSGPTIFAAIRKASTELSRRLYFSHMQVWMISSELAEKEGIDKFLDFPYRDPEFREDIPVVIAKNQSTEKVLSAQNPLEKINGISIKRHLENANKASSCTKPTEIRKVIDALMSPSRSAVVPTIFLKPDIDFNKNTQAIQSSNLESVIKADGLAVFKKDKLFGYLNSKEARSYLWVIDEMNYSVIVVPYKKLNNTIELLKSKTKLKTKLDHGKPVVDIEITIDGNVGEVDSNIDLLNVKEFDQLTQNTNNVVKKEILSTIKKMQEEYKIDIFGFGETFRHQHPKEWKKMEPKWGEEFKNLKVNVTVQTTLHNIGKKTRPFYLDRKENK